VRNWVLIHYNHQSIDTNVENNFDNNTNIDVQSEEEHVFDENTETSSFLPEIANVQLEHDAIKNDLKFADKFKWPTIENERLMSTQHHFSQLWHFQHY